MTGKVKVKDIMSKTELIKLITEYIYPDEYNGNKDEARAAKNRVRSRIDYAIKNDRLPREDKYGYSEFITSAARIKGWGKLLGLIDDSHPLRAGSVISIKSQVIGQAVEYSTASPIKAYSPIDIPEGKEDLKRLCQELNNKYWDLNDKYKTEKSELREQINALKNENSRLSAKNTQLTNEVKGWKEKDDKRRATYQRNAKKPRSRPY